MGRWLTELLDSWRAWWAMRGMRAHDRRQASDHVWDFRNLVQEARDNYEQGNRARALEVWQRAKASFPELALTSETAIALLIQMQRYDEAESLLTLSIQRHPRSPHGHEGLAEVAYKRGQLEVALEHCAALRRLHPGSVKGYWVSAAALSELGRDQEAEAILARGIAAMPDEVGLRMEYARLADRRRDWPAALQRWTEVAETHGHHAGIIGAGNALAALGRYEEADALLQGIFYKAGNDFGVWAAYASVAEQRQDWAEAAQRWAVVCRRFPLVPAAYLNAAQPFLRLNEPDKAEAVLRDGLARNPDDAGLVLEYAWLAHRRADWPEAAARWFVVRDRFPDRAEGYDRGAEALDAMGRADEAHALRQRNADPATA